MSAQTGPVELPRELQGFYTELDAIVQQFVSIVRKCNLYEKPWRFTGDGTNPVIAFVRPAAAPAPARELFCQLLRLLARYKPEWNEDTKRLEGMQEEYFAGLFACALQGDREGAADSAGRLGVRPEVAGFALSYTVKPFLQVYAEVARPYIDCENWLQSYCPVCGSRPMTAKINSAEGKRYLCCPQCETEWLFRILCCPGCGNEDHRSLAFLQVEETPGYGLHVCDRCKGYVKVIDEQKGGNPEFLSNEAATLYLDVIAQQQGYRGNGAKA